MITATAAIRLTFAEAIAHFNVEARREMMNRKNGTRGPINERTRDGIITAVRDACEAALTAHGQSTADLDAAVVGPYLSRLWTWVPDTFSAGTRKSYQSRCRAFVRVVLGVEATRRRLGRLLVATAPWAPLAEALARMGGIGRAYRSVLLSLAQLAARAGYHSPEALSVRDDVRGLVRTWVAEEEGLALHGDDRVASRRARKRAEALANKMLDAYRIARRELAAAGHTPPPPFSSVVVTGKSGLKSLADWPDRVRAGGYTGPFDALGAWEACRYIVPDLHAQIEGHIADHGTAARRGRHAGRRKPSWARRVRHGAAMVAAALCRLEPRLPKPAREIDLLDLWTLTVGECAATGQPAQATQALRAKLRGTAPVAGRARPLMRLVLDDMAAAIYRHARVRSSLAEHAEAPVPFYPADAVRAMDVVFQAFEEVVFHVDEDDDHAAEGDAEQVAQWGQVSGLYGKLKRLAKGKQEKVAAYLTGQKHREGDLPVHWGDVVGEVLPWLWREAIEAEQALRDALAHGARAEGELVARLRRDFYAKNERYLILAVTIADGMRLSQYLHGIVGHNFVITPERDRRQRWVGIRAVHCRWYTTDTEWPWAAVKMDTKGAADVPCGGQVLRPTLVDHRLLFRHLVEYRPARLVACGVLRSVQAYSPDADRWPLFVTDAPRQPREVPFVGQYSDVWFRRLWGAALRDGLVHGAGLDLPEYGDPALGARYPLCFAPHYLRTLVASFLIGVLPEHAEYEGRELKPHELACDMTHDELDTLKRRYKVRTQGMKDREHVAGRRNLYHFNALALWLLTGWTEGEDYSWFWRAYDPADPLAARHAARRRVRKGVDQIAAA
jgi:hypothetical protein